MLSRRRLLAGVALVVLAVGAAAVVYVRNENEPIEKRGSADEEFVTDAEPSSSMTGGCIFRRPRPSVCSVSVRESQGRSGTITFTFRTSQPSYSIITLTTTLYGFGTITGRPSASS